MAESLITNNQAIQEFLLIDYHDISRYHYINQYNKIKQWSIITTVFNQVIITYLKIFSPFYTNTDDLLSSSKQSFSTLNIESLQLACFGSVRIKPGSQNNHK